MESESEPRPCHNQLAVYPLKGTPKVRLQKRHNHTVRELASESKKSNKSLMIPKSGHSMPMELLNSLPAS
jgi:hypothetical protein